MLNSAADLTGTIIAQKYKLVRLLGAGGMGTVYQAQDLLVNRIVALKVLKAETDNEEAVRRFQREATIAARIDSPYCVGLLDFGVDDDRPYLVMPYIDGKSISEVIKAAPLPPTIAVDIFMQLCDGLSAAHSKGVVHRDIKPSNVILVAREEAYAAKIVDFGIAKLREPDATSGPTMTSTGEFLGSPQYMSPEQCEGQPADTRSDIYSLGILMYETLAGEPPFKDANVFAIIEKHRNGVPDQLYLTDVAKSARLALQAVVFRCLEKQRGDRYQSASDLKRALKGVSEQLAGRGSVFLAPFQVGGAFKFLSTFLPIAFWLISGFVLTCGCFFYWSNNSLFLPGSSDKRRIEVVVPNQLPPIDSEQRDAKEKRAQFQLSSIKNVAGQYSDEYLKSCSAVGDYFRTHGECELAMKYYGLENPVLDKMDLASSPEAAYLFIKQTECCLPSKYALGLQITKLRESLKILSPLRYLTKDAAVKLIEAIYLKAQCELFSATEKQLSPQVRSHLLNSAEYDFGSVLDTYKDTIKQRTELYPSEMANPLLKTGDYFFDRACSAPDADARERCAKRAIDSYRALAEQCSSSEDYSTYRVTALNQIGLLKLILRQPSSAIESFGAALTEMHKITGPFAKENRTKLRSNLFDAYWKSGDYRSAFLEWFNVLKPDNN